MNTIGYRPYNVTDVVDVRDLQLTDVGRLSELLNGLEQRISVLEQEVEAYKKRDQRMWRHEVESAAPVFLPPALYALIFCYAPFDETKVEPLPSRLNDVVLERSLDADDVQTVMNQANCCRTDAVRALGKYHNIVDAILSFNSF
jgi:NACalpha-BTF3-like transcription factor